MQILLSPSKKLDFSSPVKGNFSEPEFLSDSKILIEGLKKLNADDITKLMNLSGKLADLNVSRYKEFSTPFTKDNARQAIFAFRGNVYDGLNADNLSTDDLKYANSVLRILSGLYGVLKPLDLIQPYRLEMGTKLKNIRGKNLYEFWGNKITDTINSQCDDMLINLASNEYFKAVNKKKIKARIITPAFKDYKNGSYKSLMLYVKVARGTMANYIIRNKIKNLDDLKKFNGMGYKYNQDLSSGDEYVFTRRC